MSDLNRRDFLRLGGAAAAAGAVSLSADGSPSAFAKRSRSVDFPDFTRGRWRTNPRLVITAD